MAEYIIGLLLLAFIVMVLLPLSVISWGSFERWLRERRDKLGDEENPML